MGKFKCKDCGQEYDFVLEACPNCGCPSTPQSLSKIKCADCGHEYDSSFEACPNCGCPTANQAEQVKQNTNLSQDKAQQNKKNAKRRALFIVLPMIIAGIVVLLSIWYFGHSYERKISKFEKKADEFKATLASDNQIIAEIIDSIAQKVYYLEKNVENYDVYGAPLHKIIVHDYATDETKLVLPNTGKVDEFELCGTEFIDSKLIQDRLFFSVHTNCMWRLDQTGVFYVNIRDNSLHFVESCDKAIFRGNDKISIQKYYYLGTRGGGEHENSDCKEYELSSLLSDEAYADNRKEHMETEKRLQEEWLENEEKRRKEEEIRKVKSWLIGTWEWNGIIWGQRVWAKLNISDDYIIASSIYGVDDQGSYSIDMDNQTIHYGKYSYAKIDTRRKIIYADEGEPFRKVSNSPSFSANNGGNSLRSNNGYYGTTTFRTAADVINYTSSHTFRNNVGNSIKIDFHGMYVNGRLLTNAPRVLNFSGSTATISVSSPYTGGGAMIIRVDASNGAIVDGSGDVFRMVN